MPFQMWKYEKFSYNTNKTDKKYKFQNNHWQSFATVVYWLCWRRGLAAGRDNWIDEESFIPIVTSKTTRPFHWNINRKTKTSDVMILFVEDRDSDHGGRQDISRTAGLPSVKRKTEPTRHWLRYHYAWGLFSSESGNVIRTLTTEYRVSCVGSMSRKRAPTPRCDDLHMAESMVKLTKRCAKTCQHETA